MGSTGTNELISVTGGGTLLGAPFLSTRVAHGEKHEHTMMKRGGGPHEVFNREKISDT